MSVWSCFHKIRSENGFKYHFKCNFLGEIGVLDADFCNFWLEKCKFLG